MDIFLSLYKELLNAFIQINIINESTLHDAHAVGYAHSTNRRQSAIQSPFGKYWQHHPYRTHARWHACLYSRHLPSALVDKGRRRQLSGRCSHRQEIPVKSAEGIELNKEVYMPIRARWTDVLVFEALPEETQVIHLLSPSDTEGNTYDISLVPSSGKKRFAVGGNQGKLVQGR